MSQRRKFTTAVPAPTPTIITMAITTVVSLFVYEERPAFEEYSIKAILLLFSSTI